MEHARDVPRCRGTRRPLRPPDGGRDDLLGEAMRMLRLRSARAKSKQNLSRLRDRVYFYFQMVLLHEQRTAGNLALRSHSLDRVQSWSQITYVDGKARGGRCCIQDRPPLDIHKHDPPNGFLAPDR